MKINFAIFLLLFTKQVFSQNSTNQSISLKYNNIIILSDLSSRLANRPPKDVESINKIISFFRNQCVKPGKKIGDKSSIYFSVFSNRNTAHIDLEEFVDINEKQSFVNSTGNYSNKGLDYRIGLLKKTILNQYSNTRNAGLDLISLLNEKIENELIVKKNKVINVGSNSKKYEFENHIYLFTDGYLEFQTKNASKQFYFGTKEIEKIRKYCTANNVNLELALKKVSGLGISPIQCPKNQNINLHIMETHERDKDIKAQTYKNPLGLRDNEILEAVWEKWALDSGFKSFEWRKY